MTLFDNYAFEIVDDENGALEIAAEGELFSLPLSLFPCIPSTNKSHSAPKLPFDANDYLNFELNEAFIVPSADFMNNYRVSSASLSSMSSITNIQELSLDITEDDAVATAASEIPNCLWEDQTINTYDDSLNEFIDYDITLSMPTGSNNTPSGARSPLGDTTVSMNHSRQEAEATFNYKTTFPNYAYTHPFTTDTHHKHTSYSNIPSPSNLVKGKLPYFEPFLRRVAIHCFMI
ncbi:CYFA0S05e01112g1_1 [Cyberlindnera fabianii]|uniref:CYFA0S05e01112g1_1 n=1 Tax=Cyberlindnera fabianii TaxID=36022 RepID=A0A061ASH7_CYBFA|nr:hypothetical protein BON22_2221 [Cyberlindnera fabianii]CDR40496.1 CYFA0S05e01112g1_1 [Cyberlindnera fabianii]